MDTIQEGVNKVREEQDNQTALILSIKDLSLENKSELQKLGKIQDDLGQLSQLSKIQDYLLQLKNDGVKCMCIIG